MIIDLTGNTVIRRLWDWMEEHIVKRTHRIAHVETYEVFGDELDAIESGYSSRQNDISFLSIAASTFVSFLIVMFTSPQPDAPTWREQMYWGILISSAFASAYLAIRWRRSVTGEKQIFEKIRARSVGPLGEEGKELKPAELEKLPTGAPAEKREEA